MDATGIISSGYQLSSLRPAYQSTRSRVENFKLSWWTTEAWFQKNVRFLWEMVQTTQVYMFEIWTWFSHFRVWEFNSVSWQSFALVFCWRWVSHIFSHWKLPWWDVWDLKISKETFDQIIKKASFSSTFETFWEYIYIYIYAPDVHEQLVAAASKARMRPISAGVASGSSLAVAWKALNWLDRPVDPWTFCNSFQAPASFDWFAFAIGLVCGAILCAFIELLLTLRWAICRAVVTAAPVEPAELGRVAQSRKPLCKLLWWTVRWLNSELRLRS